MQTEAYWNSSLVLKSLILSQQTPFSMLTLQGLISLIALSQGRDIFNCSTTLGAGQMLCEEHPSKHL